MSTNLTDLDELALTVRDKQSQSYILEAISAYRGRAYRSAIISTWISVTYDIIAKLRELANKNDAAAENFVKELDTAIANRNIAQMQKLEDGVLEKAAKEFEFLADHEYEDLKRLKDDRNRCAHPAFVSETVLFQPSPELVRAHIVHAIVHLLQHHPVQGKSALERIMADLKRPSFPLTADEVHLYLEKNYLGRSKSVLVRNLINLLLKNLFHEDLPAIEAQKNKLLLSLLAISRSQPSIYEQEMASRLPSLVDSREDKELIRIYWLLSVDPRCWHWIPDAQRVLLRNLTTAIGKSKEGSEMFARYSVFNALAIPDLNSFLLRLFSNLDDYDQQKIIALSPRPEFVRTAIELYSRSGSYRGAEERGTNLILPLAEYLTPGQISDILVAAKQNSQILYARGTGPILETLFDLTREKLVDTGKYWKDFIGLTSKEEGEWSYGDSFPGLRKRLTDAGILDK